MFDKVLNMLLNWLPKLNQLEYTDNLPLGKTKKKEQPNFKIVERKC